MSTTNNTATLVAAFNARMDFINASLNVELASSTPDEHQVQMLSMYRDNPKTELYDVAYDLGFGLDTIAAALSELTGEAPKEQNTDFMSWKHLDEETQAQAMSDYRTFFMLHPGQKNPTDPNTDAKWEYMGIIGRKRYAAMNAARKSSLEWTRAKYWNNVASKEVA